MDMEVEYEYQRPRRSVGGAASSLWGSIRELGSTLVDYGKSQLQQLGDGVEQEIRRAAEAIMWAAFAAVLCGAGLLMAGITVIVGFWDTPHRLLAAILVTAGMFVVAGISLLMVRNKLKSKASVLAGAAQAGVLLAAYKRLIR